MMSHSKGQVTSRFLMNTASTLIREALMKMSFKSLMEASRRLDIVGPSVILVFLDATSA
jgi:hypothetical protein